MASLRGRSSVRPLLLTAFFIATPASYAGAGVLPAGWISADVGAPATPGSASFDEGTFTVTGGGADIGGSSDQFMFVYQAVTGDTTIVARVATLDSAVPWSLAGIMIRETLAADSKHGFLHITQSKGLEFSLRSATGGSTQLASEGIGAAPVWLRLERRSDLLTAYRSENGILWTAVGSVSLPMTSVVYLGLAVSSHNPAKSVTSTVTDVTVGTPGLQAEGAQAPLVSLTSPTDGSTYVAPASVPLEATASDVDGRIARVEFYTGTTLIGTDTSSPYSLSWTNVAAGTYSLTAMARDHSGDVTVSSARTILVTDALLPDTAVFTPSSNHATAVDRYVVAFYFAGSDPRVSNPVASTDIGKPGVVNGECVADVSATVTALTSGSYIATVTAIGPGGTATSAPSSTFTR